MSLPPDYPIMQTWPKFYIFLVTGDENNIMTNLTSKIVKEKEGGGGEGGLLKLDSKIGDKRGDDYVDYLSLESENENFVRVYYGNMEGNYYIVFNRVTSSVHFQHVLVTMLSLQSKRAIRFYTGWMVNSDGSKILVIDKIVEEKDHNTFTSFFHSINYGPPTTIVRITEEYLKLPSQWKNRQ